MTNRHAETELREIRATIRAYLLDNLTLREICYKLNLEFCGIFTVRNDDIYRESASPHRLSSTAMRVTL